MAKTQKGYTRFAGGIADFIRESLVPDSFAFGRSVDIRSDPQNLGILPRTIKESGSTVIDLPKFSDTIPTSLDTYIYGNGGNIYKRTFSGSYSRLTTVPNSHGNGLTYFAGDDYVYFTSDNTIGRYGPISSATPNFSYDFLASQGGIPLNTNSLQLLSASSQYASRADTASLSITGDLALEAQIKPATLPAVGSSMTLAGKWNESAALRSYKLDIYGISGYFGDGSDGALIISSDTTESPIDSACTGTAGLSTLSATNVSFVQGQVILIHQTQGVNAGQWERNTIAGYSAGTITLATPLLGSYVSGAQVRVMKQYSSITINSGKSWSAKPWNGTVGGILSNLCSGSIIVNGNILANGCGFRGGLGGAPGSGIQGEGVTGLGSVSSGANSSGGGGGDEANGGDEEPGGGGGNGTVGGQNTSTIYSGLGGTTTGSADLTNINLGGGGGGAGSRFNNQYNFNGSSGGGIIFLTGVSITVSGSITAQGLVNTGSDARRQSGCGAGGSILLKAQIATLGSGLIDASGGVALYSTGGGPNGGLGRITLDYLTSYTGTTTPNLNPILDNTLVTNTTYQLRLGLSADGTAAEFLTKNANLSVVNWQDVGVSWHSATSTAEFFLNAVSLGTSTGTLTSINDNASRFEIGSDINSGGVNVNFYNGLIDEVRAWNTTRSASDFLAGQNQQIAANSAGLQAYFKLNNDYTDATSNANHLTATNSPTFSTDVPFASATTRLDIDQSASTVGNTYTVPTAISEASSDKLIFVPAKDPQKSIAVNIASVGTGNWTLTVHDSNNLLIASKTVANAALHSGLFEFVFDTPWSPLTNFTNNYHFHLTSTVADGTVVTSSGADLSTVTFTTYFSFLIDDSDFHPLARFLNFWVVGNGRYIGKYDATLYDPNFIALPAGYRVRCFGFWQGFLVIGTWRGTSITDFDIGEVFIWDGIGPTFNDHFPVPEGGVNALLGANGVLNIWAGYQGKQFIWQGYGPVVPVKRIPKASDDTFVEIFPQAVTMWRSLIRYGVAGNSDSLQIQKGVYTWGRTNSYYPEILTYDYPISTGSLTGTNLKIGLLTTVGGKLLIGWQDNLSYGIDYVSGSNSVFPSARIEFLINDDDMVWKQKQAVNITAVFDTLLTGQSISLQHRLDDNTNWITNPDQPAIGSTDSRMSVIAGRYNQIQVGIDLTTSVLTGPVVNGLALEIESHDSSGRLGSGS